MRAGDTTNTTQAARYETREVLAGAYRGKASAASMLTHLVDNDAEIPDGSEQRSMCSRAKNLADAYSLDAARRAARPTCEACGKKWDRLVAGAAHSRSCVRFSGFKGTENGCTCAAP